MKWKWKAGDGVAPLALGTPQTTTRYELCLYDRTGGVAELVTSYEVLPTPIEWSVKPGQVKYSDTTGSQNGVTQIKGKANAAPGKSSMSMKLKGANFDVPDVANVNEFFDVDPSMTVQLVTSDGSCWTTDFTEGNLRKNTTLQFSAKAP
jgi:hypothetical protein